jgi:hypothetical protein
MHSENSVKIVGKWFRNGVVGDVTGGKWFGNGYIRDVTGGKGFGNGFIGDVTERTWFWNWVLENVTGEECEMMGLWTSPIVRK